MPIGINNITTVTLTNITDIANVTNPIDFFVRVNQIVYEGVLFFTLLLVLWLILFLIAQRIRDYPMHNAMTTGAVMTVLAFIARIIGAPINGTMYYLITDLQMWLFPIVTIVIAVFIYAGRKD